MQVTWQRMTRQECDSNVANMADLAVDMAHMLTSLLTWIGLKLARPECDVS